MVIIKVEDPSERPWKWDEKHEKEICYCDIETNYFCRAKIDVDGYNVDHTPVSKGTVNMQKRRGRPTDNPRPLTIPETRVSREENRMIRLKAALYAGGNVAEFMRLAATQYKGQMKTLNCISPNCDGLMQMSYADETHFFKVSNRDHVMVLRGVPVYECNCCHNRMADVNLSAELEGFINEEIEFRLKNYMELPTEIDFDSLISL